MEHDFFFTNIIYQTYHNMYFFLAFAKVYASHISAKQIFFICLWKKKNMAEWGSEWQDDSRVCEKCLWRVLFARVENNMICQTLFCLPFHFVFLVTGDTSAMTGLALDESPLSSRPRLGLLPWTDMYFPFCMAAYPCVDGACKAPSHERRTGMWKDGVSSQGRKMQRQDTSETSEETLQANVKTTE